MNQEEQVQVYMDGLQERAKSLTGVQLELAGYVVEIAGSTYLRGDEKMFLNTDKLLGRLAAETQKPLFEPLLDVLQHLASESLVARFRYIAERATRFPYSNNYERRPFRTSDPSSM